MTLRFSVCLVLTLFVTVILATTLSAQTQTAPPCVQPCPTPTPSTPSAGSSVLWELYPNAGGIWPSRVDTLSNNKIKAEGIYGLKGGVYFGSTFQLEGSFGYLNHFEPSRSLNLFDINTAGGIGQPFIQAFLYDLNFAFNFGNRS